MIDWNDNYYHRCEYCKHCGPTTTTNSGDGPIHKCWCKLDGIPGPLHDYYGKACSRWEHTTYFDKEAKTLTLPLKKKWFDMIKSGQKKEEYRSFNEFWTKRLLRKHSIEGRQPTKKELVELVNFHECDMDSVNTHLRVYDYFNSYDRLVFTLGYPKADDTERRLTFKNPRIRIDTGRPEWGAEPGKVYFVITWEE